jgi:hypothetical protein
MPVPRAAVVTMLALIALTANAGAQHSPGQPDSARTQIHSTLRAFYFNLAHHDWNALTADILAAKVVAHRTAPEALVTAVIAMRRHPSGSSGEPASPGADLVGCSSTAAALVDQAAILFEDNWAEVAVPRCTAGSTGLDQFRLIKFEKRWRIVFIELFQKPMSVSADH